VDSPPRLVESPEKRLGRHGAVGVLTQLGELRGLDSTVKPHAQPTAVPNVWRPKEPLWVTGGQGFLLTRWSGAPQVWKVEGMVALPPHGNERLPALDEQCRHTVTEPLLDLRQVSAGPTDGVDVGLLRVHVRMVERRGCAGMLRSLARH
jgi:hypothetical protein